jgi:hypothetical protein
MDAGAAVVSGIKIMDDAVKRAKGGVAHGGGLLSLL